MASSRIDWPRLAAAATLTTVSPYMRECMRPLGVDPLVIPNGIPADVFLPVRSGDVSQFRASTGERTVLAKMARFDPDKRWIPAIEIVAHLKRHGERPLLIARGGAEAHGAQVLGRASELGLRVAEHSVRHSGPTGLLETLQDLEGLDVLLLGSHVDPGARRLQLRGAARMPCWRTALSSPSAWSGSRRWQQGVWPVRAGSARASAHDCAWPHVLERCLLPRVGLPVALRQAN